MNFNDKLVFLMNITQTSNKELANGISVDPSLISLLRNGKRKQPQNPNHIKNMAVFFSKKCNADFQRNALSEILGQSIIRSSMPAEILANRLEKWLANDSDFTDQILSAIEPMPATITEASQSDIITEPESDASFYFGEQGRREVMKRMMKIIKNTQTPSSILISSDDNLEWLLSDYILTKQIQADMMEVIKQGFTIYQIMPAINFLPRYTEALQFWLPMYTTGHVKVYYYPRLRDNLYRRSMIILPEHCVRISSAIGLGSSSDVTMFSTDPKVVNAHVMQFQEHFSMCRPALSAYTEFKDFTRLFSDISSRNGNHINMATSLSPNTIPQELYEQLIMETESPDWKELFKENLEQSSGFEMGLKNRLYIDMIRLATPDEIRSGKVYIASPYKTYPEHPAYTPETYILHLKNIIRLMKQYDNYFFVPFEDNDWINYNLIVNSEGLALLIRTSTPPLMIEMQRPELVMACYEHLMRKAEKIGYMGIHKQKNLIQIQNLIKELER